MSLLEALILGIVQGLTEFLPVSSSGHLELVKALFGDEKVPEESLMFSLVLHFATALSTLVIYRKDLLGILSGGLKLKVDGRPTYFWLIVISMIPAAGIGFFFEEEIEQFFGDNILLVGFMLLVTAALLLIADYSKEKTKKLGVLNAFAIGISQAIALMPGISRSGATISTAVALGISRQDAARFSFLMVVPLILGKMILDLRDISEIGASMDWSNVLVGFSAAFISGLIACRWMIKLVRKAKLSYFAIYCIVVGCIAIFMA